MTKENCWEHKKCGRNPNGDNAHELGICPASIEKRLDNVNHGKNAGRACWVLAGTLCGGKVQGTYASKLGSCLSCEFFKQVTQEEGADFMGTRAVIDKLQ